MTCIGYFCSVIFEVKTGYKKEEEAEKGDSKMDNSLLKKENDDAVVVKKQHEDALREIRAMTLLSLPCPPLPVMVTREDEADTTRSTGEYSVANSHDMIAHAMNLKVGFAASGVELDPENEMRRKLQSIAHARLFTRFDVWMKEHCKEVLEVDGEKEEGDETVKMPPMEMIWDTFCRFTREYVKTFDAKILKSKDAADAISGNGSKFWEEDMPDVRMVPWKSVHQTHGIRFQTKEFVVAQDTLYGPCRIPGRVRTLDCMTYEDLVKLCAYRIVASSV